MMRSKYNLCHCGKPLYYFCKETEQKMLNLVSKLGEFVNVVIGDKIYKVQRHYIALHGIKGKEMESYGFERINNETNN